jgi:C4-dicarboxylate-specific signal transduction histidine kinase
MTGVKLVNDNPHEAGQQLGEEIQLADIGAAVGPVMHELGNQINTIFLSLGSLERKVPEEWREQFQELRQLGRRVAAMTNQFAGFRSKKQPPPYPLDLNQVVQATLDELNAPEHVSWEPAPNLPPVLAIRSDLKRLIRFLTANARNTVTNETPRVCISTRHQSQIQLRLKDNGPPLQGETHQSLFEPFSPVRDGANSLELAACQSLLRRWNGSLHAENHPEGGVVWTATFIAAENARDKE